MGSRGEGLGSVARRWIPGAVAWTLVGGLSAGLAAPATYATNWPHWRGPQRNGISSETDWGYHWAASGPRKLWSAKLGEGFSGMAVAGGRLYSMGNAAGKDTVFCLNADTGKQLWSQSYPCPSGDYGGPRATPTVDGKRLYTFSRQGQAYCFDLSTGKPVWSVDLPKTAGAQVPRWGFAGSVLIDGPRAIYNAGGAGTALDKTTGKILWKSPGGTAGYSTPVPFNLGGQPGVALFTSTGVAAVGPASGHRLWDYPWKTMYEVNAADPIFLGPDVFISSNYDAGCARLRVAGGRPSVVWQNKNMRNHVNSCVAIGDSLYGNDQNTLKCLDARTGAERWQRRGIGKGGLIAAAGNLLVLTERGELLIVRATPSAYQELARAQILSGTCWTAPVLANGKLYCRSHEGDLVCADLRTAH